MNKLMRIVAVTTILLLNSGTIFAQEKEQSSTKPRGLAEFRAGQSVSGYFINANDVDHYSYGGLFALYPFHNDESLLNKVSLRFSYEKTQSEEYKTQRYPKWGNFPGNKFQEYRKHPNLSFGFDIIQKSRLHLTLHGGISTIYSKVFESWAEYRCPSDGKEIYDSRECVFAGYSKYSEYKLGQWDFQENGGVAVRVFPKKNAPFFLGADWTRQEGFWRSSPHKNSVVATAGIVF